MPRKSKGRQRIKIEKIAKEKSSLVTFSKRRSGIFKKASELCTLCGVQIAIIVLSKTGKKVYSFGDPGVEVLLNRYLEQSVDSPVSKTSQMMVLLRNANIQELNAQLTNMLDQLETEKKASEELNKIRKDSQEHCWWDAPIENLGIEELERLKLAMLKLEGICARQAERLPAVAANPTPVFYIPGSIWIGCVDP